MSDDTTRVTLQSPPPTPPPSETQWPAQPPPPPSRRGVSAGTILLGGLLVVVGILWLLQSAGVIETPWRAILPGALIAIGVAVLLEARHGLHGGLVALGIILTLALSVASIVDVPLAGGVGEREHQPTTVAAIDSPYELGVGDMTVDLSAVDFPAGETSVVARVGIGELVVILPADVGVVVDWRVGAGEFTLFQSFNQSGVNQEGVETRDGSSGRTVRLEVRMGIGEIEVRHAR